MARGQEEGGADKTVRFGDAAIWREAIERDD
jgi:hypothetical protein